MYCMYDDVVDNYTMDSSIAKEQFVEVKERKAVGKKIRVKMM